MILIEGFFFWGKYNENEWSIKNVWRGKGWKILVYILFIKNVNKKKICYLEVFLEENFNL